MTGGSEFQTAADSCAVQRRDRWHTAAADHREDSVPGSGVVERLCRLPSAVLGEVKAGAKAVAMPEYHQRPSLLLRALYRGLKPGQERFADCVAFLRAIQP
jgi:hypothetical protein